jgi:transposase InsO family protein
MEYLAEVSDPRIDRNTERIAPNLLERNFTTDAPNRVWVTDEFLKALAAYGARPSMSRKGDCWDNAVAESFSATIKTERLDTLSFADCRAVTREIADYVDGFYNPTRLHSTMGYISPIKFELLYAIHQMAA